MQFEEDARYRLRLARGFLQEAEQDYGLRRWRSCVDNAQLSVENAAKAILALFGPLAKTHEPSAHLRKLLEEHFLTDYGDEATYRDPWSLFGEGDARRVLEAARRCASGAAGIFEEFPR